MARKKAQLVVAEICLYGTSRVGHGYLARAAAYPGKMHGTGEPSLARGATSCVFLACDDLRRAGCPDGIVRVFAPGGERMAEIELSNPPYYGDMKWQPAPMFVIEAEALIAAAV